ncbi:MAG: hypothetical protein IKM28_03030 [Lachnospiraceae bacterium]|nr:hypothetical protein [Lachnospiraceae bacterium]
MIELGNYYKVGNGRCVLCYSRQHFCNRHGKGIGTSPSLRVWHHHVGDETGINNQEYHIRGFSSKGVAPEISVCPKIEKINIISAIDNYGSCRFMCDDTSMT